MIEIAELILTTLDLVHKRREGALSKEEAQNLFARIFLSLLWEIHDNLDRCKYMYDQYQESKEISLGVLTFSVRDALFTDFCISCPEPTLVADVNRIYAAFTRIQHWQASEHFNKEDRYLNALGWVEDLFDKELDKRYNDLCDLGNKLGNYELEVPPRIPTPDHIDYIGTTIGGP